MEQTLSNSDFESFSITRNTITGEVLVFDVQEQRNIPLEQFLVRIQCQ